MYYFLLPLFCFLGSLGFSQTYVYLGNQQSMSNRVYEIQSEEVVKYTSGIFKETQFRQEGSKIFVGRSGFQCAYTVDGNKIYKGDSYSPFDLVYELKGNKVYLHTPGMFEKCIYTFDKGSIYWGDSTSNFDLVLSYSQDATPEQIILILVAIGPV